MQKFLSLLFSRRALAVVGVLVLALLVWFVGPLVSFDTLRPLASVGSRVNVADLTAQSPAERLAACAALRARLAELRETLGIRFPVYLVVTKMDLLPGFSEYFRTLTSHLRAQIWGFTLPYSRRRKAGDPQALHAACAQELARLTLRLDQGLDTRLQEEYDLKSRQRLYTFPREFAALGEPLLEAIEQIFLDSKFDATQLNNTLRGVFFTSAAQAQADAVADQLSIWQRFVRAIKTARGESSASLPHALPDGNRSYFLHDLLTQFIFREAHLVEPNLQWAWRYRLLVLVLAFLLWQGMQTSQQTNGDYLNEISARATRLDGDVKAYTGKRRRSSRWYALWARMRERCLCVATARRWIGACRVFLPVKDTGSCSTNDYRNLWRRRRRTMAG